MLTLVRSAAALAAATAGLAAVSLNAPEASAADGDSRYGSVYVFNHSAVTLVPSTACGVLQASVTGAWGNGAPPDAPIRPATYGSWSSFTETGASASMVGLCVAGLSDRGGLAITADFPLTAPITASCRLTSSRVPAVAPAPLSCRVDVVQAFHHVEVHVYDAAAGPVDLHEGRDR